MLGWDLLVVILVVAVAVVWTGRAVWRSVRAGKVCSDCADSGSCPLIGKTGQTGAETPFPCHPANGFINCPEVVPEENSEE